MILHLDMDGVVADFVAGLSELHQRQNPYLNPHETRWGFYECWGMTEQEAYAPVNEEFWIGLKKTPWCDWFLQSATYLFEAENIFFLSKPIARSNAYEGKGEWLKRNTQFNIDRLLIGKPKYAAAHMNSALFDDNDRNVTEYIEAGGRGIVCPGPFNSLRGIYHSGEDAIRGYLLEQLIKLKD